MTRRRRIIQFLGLLLSGVAGKAQTGISTLSITQPPPPTPWILMMDGMSQLSIQYKGETITITPKEIMEALREPEPVKL